MRIKKKGLFFSIAFAILFVGTVLPVQGQGLGVVGGLNFTSMSDVELGDREVTLDRATGYHIGAYLDVPLGPISARPGIRYLQAGPVYEGFRDEGTTAVENFSFDVNYVVIPVDVKLQLPFPIVNPYIFAGPEVQFQNAPDAPENIKDALSGRQLAGNIGVGAAINLPVIPFTITPEARYTTGLTNYFDETITIGGQELEPAQTDAVRLFQLTVGAQF